MIKFSTLLSLCLCLFVFGCTFTEKIRDGKTAYERMQYSVAADLLKEEYTKEKSRVEKGKMAFMIGESFSKMNKNASSIEWYKKAYDHQYGTDALKAYSFALKQEERYDEAQKAFKELGIEIGSPYEYRREVTACEQAADWKAREDQTGFEVSLSEFNSNLSDYAPTVFKDNQLIITSDRKDAVGDDTYKWTGNNFSDLFLVDLNSNTASPFDDVINSVHNEGTVTFSEDYNEIYFSRCYSVYEDQDHYCKLMVSRMEGDSWTAPTILNFVEDNVNYGHPSLAKDGSILYFASDHPDGWGGYDIYYTERTPDGWDAPRLMSRSINTVGNEKFPFIDADTLYFASDHHIGMGGLDIFRTYLMEKDNWSPVNNLKAPINSGGDDFGYAISYAEAASDDVIQVGYLSSSRADGTGFDDIYRFEKSSPPPPPPPPEPDPEVEIKEPEPIVYKMILEGFVVEKIYEFDDNPESKVLGRKPLNEANVQINFGGEQKTVKVGADGKFTIELEDNTDYRFFANKSGYLNGDERFSSKGLGKDPNNPVQKYEVEILLDKIFKNKEITLDNIYYDYEKWDIRSDAQPTLNELANTLQDNPQIKIRLSSHTDCRGGNNYNQNLSQKRAQSAVDYLISRGIQPARLSAVGYGENALKINCNCGNCSEDEHQANRRTTFTILE